MKTMLILALAFAAGAHKLNLKWTDREVSYLEINDGETLEVTLPSSQKTVKVKFVKEYQMVTPCLVKRLVQTATATKVWLTLGETNRDDGMNGCVARISGDRNVLIEMGYSIDE